MPRDSGPAVFAPVSFSRMKGELDEPLPANMPKWTIHDIRRTVERRVGWRDRMLAPVFRPRGRQRPLFNSSEKRLARLLLLLANFGKNDEKPVRLRT
jgi:hypothetical protein